MPAPLCELDRYLIGPTPEIEHRWVLICDEDAQNLLVEHEWSHTNPQPLEVCNGVESSTMVAFLKTDDPETATARKVLTSYLKEYEDEIRLICKVY
jgi:hypothetical protein